jgi:RNA polymerase sigma factor (sigma-70 family)
MLASPTHVRGTAVPDLDARAEYELLRASRDDPAAFRTFYDHWSRPVLGFFQRRLHDPDVALELTAETFAVAFEQRGRFRWMGKSPGAWLFGIARRLLYRYLRTQQVQQRAIQRLGVEVPGNDDESFRRIEELSDNEGMRELVRAALDSCKEGDRIVLELRFIEAMPYPELADFLGCTVNAARVRVHRALARIERRLSELEQEQGAARLGFQEGGRG